MNWADYGILAIVILSILIGVLRGFTRELFGVGTWVLAIVLAVVFGSKAAVALQEHIATPLVRMGAAYGIRQSRFSSADRTLGAGLGMIRGILIVGLVVLLARTVDVSEEAWWRESALIGPSMAIADALDTLIPDSWLDPLKPDPKPPVVPEPGADDAAKPAAPAAPA